MVALAVWSLACGKTEQPAAASSEPAGKVEAVEGPVTATRAAEGSVARPLQVAAAVYADDTVAAPAGASVSIRLAHNGALWRLEGGLTKRVDQTAAWKVPKDAVPQAIAQRPENAQTASAGRHSEHEAAGSAESAVRAAPPPAPAPVPPAADAPPPSEPAADKPAAAAATERHSAKPASHGRPAGASAAPPSGTRGGGGDLDDDFGASNAKSGGLGGVGSGGGNVGGDHLGGVGGPHGSGDGIAQNRPAPRISIAVAGATGELKMALTKAVNLRKGVLARCAQQVAQSGVPLPAKIVVHIEIGGAGAVTVVAIDGAPEAMKGCLRAAFATLRGLPDTNPAAEAEITVGLQ